MGNWGKIGKQDGNHILAMPVNIPAAREKSKFVLEFFAHTKSFISTHSVIRIRNTNE